MTSTSNISAEWVEEDWAADDSTFVAKSKQSQWDRCYSDLALIRGLLDNWDGAGAPGGMSGIACSGLTVRPSGCVPVASGNGTGSTGSACAPSGASTGARLRLLDESADIVVLDADPAAPGQLRPARLTHPRRPGCALARARAPPPPLGGVLVHDALMGLPVPSPHAEKG